MSINTKQIADYIVDPVLEALELKGRNMMLGIAAQESHMGTYIHQINGSAKGLWQVEDATHDDVWRYLFRKDDPYNTKRKRNKWMFYFMPYPGFRPRRLIYDLCYCCAIARIKLYMIPESLPTEDDIWGMANYWKQYYNTNAGKGSEEQFVHNYNKYIKPYL